MDVQGDCAVPESVIFRAIKAIDNRSEEIGKLIDELEGKLGSILSSEPQPKTEGCDKETSSCSLEGKLCKAGDTITDHRNRLQSILSRLRL